MNSRVAGLALLIASGASLLYGSVRATAMPDGPRPPRLLSETGLYLTDGITVDPRNRPFSPQYPLWSDGAVKTRWVFLPEGAAIDATDIDAWDFPTGTKFWKEFSFGGRRVETRLLWKARPDRWVFGSYLWTGDQTAAALAPEEGVRGHVEIAPGKRHTIPSVEDCRACHDSARTEVLGFSALQLSTDRDPNAPHAEWLDPAMVTLATLATDGTLRPARSELVQHPPRIHADTPRARAALGYLSANCGGCHNAASSVVSTLRLKQPALADSHTAGAWLRALVGGKVGWDIPSAPPGTTRFAQSGQPDHSSIVQRMRSRRPSSQMPPLGTVLQDQAAVQLITDWIREDLPALVSPAH